MMALLPILSFLLLYISASNAVVSESVTISHATNDTSNNEVYTAAPGTPMVPAIKRPTLLRKWVAPLSDLNLEDRHHDVGSPLFLTPLINQGKIKEARNLSRVLLPNDAGDTHSFSGYLTVDEKYNSNMFFWFFPAKKAPYEAPLLIWLQGGPGGSSLFGLFGENGPFNVDKDMKLVYRNYSWTNTHNVLYFDNPVGTGFSFTDSDEGYARDEVAVGENLYRATQQFLQLFPELRHQDLYVSGESYAGKYVPALSYAIHKHNPTAEQKINFRGMAIGDGLCDPVTMTDYGDFLYGVGLVDEVQRDLFRVKEDRIRRLIANRLWGQAFLAFDELVNGDVSNYTSLLTNTTGLTCYYNYLMTKEPEDLTHYSTYVNLPAVRRAIHVGNLTFHNGAVVEQHLLDDVMQSVKPWIEELLNQRQYRVMIYSGQLDIIIAYTLTRNFVESLQWRDAALYRQAPRRIWRDGSDVAGYVKETPNFLEVLVRGAGHMVPHDQPRRAYDMINRFTGAGRSGKPGSFFKQG